MGEGKCCEGGSAKESEGKGGCCPGGNKNKLLIAIIVLGVLAAGAFALCKSGVCPFSKGSSVSAQK